MPLESPKGDAQRPGAVVAAARGCGWRCGCACPTGRLRDRPRRRGTAVAARRQYRARGDGLRGGARNPHWCDLDTPKVFRRPGTNFRYRREPPSNFRVCPLFGTPPSIGAPGDLEKPPKSASFCYEYQPGEWPERYDAPRASLDVAVRAGTEQTTPRGLGAAVSGFGGPCTLPLRRR